MTWLGVLNFVVLQWFGVRLARVWARETHAGRVASVWMVGHAAVVSVGREARLGRRVAVGWRFIRWVWPLTGWWSDYRWVARRS